MANTSNTEHIIWWHRYGLVDAKWIKDFPQPTGKFRKNKEITLRNFLYNALFIHQYYELHQKVPKIAIAMGKDNFRSWKAAYGLTHFTHHHVKDILDALVADKWIMRVKGSGSASSLQRKATRLHPKKRLLDWLRDNFQSINTSLISPTSNIQIRKKEHGTKILVSKSKFNKELKSLEKNIRIINTENQKHQISFQPSRTIKTKRLILHSNKNTYHRVFNGDLDHGGRFFGHEVQLLEKKFRNHVLIDGDPTSEKDFSGCHPRMLYALAGIQYDEYPYNIPDLVREDAKKVFMILINSKSNRSYSPAIRNAQKSKHSKNKINDKRTSKQLKTIIDNHHPQIKHLLCNGLGLKLMNFDAQIAELVMLDFCKRKKPIICIHDGFRVKAKDEQLLEKLMKKYYKQIIGFDPVIQ